MRIFLICSCLALAEIVFAQQPTSGGRDTTGVAALKQAQLALTGGTPVGNMIMQSNVSRSNGATTEAGAAVMKTKGALHSRVELKFGPHQRIAVRDSSDAVGGGEMTDDSGPPHAIPGHNCFVPAAWFSPAAIVESMLDPTLAVSYVGMEKRDGVAVTHVRTYRMTNSSTRTIDTFLRHLSIVDLYLDVTSHLPLFLSVMIHPEKDGSRDFPAEFRFADYRDSNGVAVPFRIQTVVNGQLSLDLQVQSVVLAQNVNDGDFTLHGRSH